jgi:UDP-N-acetylmuramyl pentapeptide phosphotransferase/UDP-N-acetylglucosamine-1-phosphate transferase
MLTKTILVLAVSFVAAWQTTKLLTRWLRARGVMDVPNERSSHRIPTPRGGGLGILAGLAFGWFVAWRLGMQVPRPELLIGATLIALVGLIDDRFGLPVVLRLILQFVAAGLVVFRAGGLEQLPLPHPLNVWLGFLAMPAALVWMVGVTNLYNFLDGIDGHAGLQGAIAGLGIALFHPDGFYLAAGMAIAGACAGFLLHNWHPAKIFMGDVGSATLGFILASLPFQLHHPALQHEAVIFVVICLWFFLSDGVFTILRRLIRGERIWEAHRTHLYQRLVISGLRHDQVVSKVMTGGAFLMALALWSWYKERPLAQWGVLGVGVAGFLVLLGWTVQRERQAQKVKAEANAKLMPTKG